MTGYPNDQINPAGASPAWLVGKTAGGVLVPVKINDDGSLVVSTSASGDAVNLTGIGGVAPSVGAGVADAGTLRVALAGGAVTVSNFPATQPVSGTVAVSNLPATQPVSGSVSVSNFPGTQPVSGTVTSNPQFGGAAAAVAPGTTGVLQVGGAQVTVVQTPTVTASAYSTGFCLGGLNSLSVAQFNGQSGFLTNFRIVSLSAITTSVVCYLFDSNPTGSTFADHGAATLATADIDKLIATPFTLSGQVLAGSTASFASQTNMGLPFIAGGSSASGVKTIYYALVLTAAATPGSTTDIHVKVGVAF